MTRPSRESPAESAAALPNTPSTASPPDFFFQGIRIHNLTEDETLAAIAGLLGEAGEVDAAQDDGNGDNSYSGSGHYLAVVNAAKLVAASEDEALRRILQQATLVTADGMAVVWASRLLGQGLKERVTGIDVFERLVGEAAARGWSVYFLGARQQMVSRVVEVLQMRHGDLRVAGYRNGYFTPAEEAEVIEEIRRCQADLLFVALGSPAQEKWIAANLEKTGARFAMGVGGSFDHICGKVRRAPRWMQRAGLEWLHRLWLEPRRLWRRYLVGNTRFIWLAIKTGRQRK